MNNSRLMLEEIEQKVDIKPMLRQKQTELTEILEAIKHVNASSYWKVLQDKVFGGVLESLQHRIRSEKNPTEIYRLQGQIVWAEKYSDLKKLVQVYENELINIKKKLNG